MSYDHWKTTEPDPWQDYESGQEHDEELKGEERLPCGCIGKCDPFAHDTAWDWNGTPDYDDEVPF
jgi:hypothetical protein